MLAVFSGGDAVVIGAFLTLVGTVYNSRRTGRQFKPNGGKTLRDAIDRIEANGKRLEAKVDKNGERIAVLEAAHEVAHRPPNTRTP